MQAIILCGGKGTRLRSVIGEKQKTMTMIDDTPFLVHVINYLKSFGIRKVIFATGYKSHEVRDYFGDTYFFGVEVKYSEEKVALGTGGAIRNALEKIEGDSVIVLNGDTLFNADITKLIDNHKSLDTDMSIACKATRDKKRFGTIKFSDTEGIISEFSEKISDDEEGYINGGVYIMKKSLIESIEPNVAHSLEKELIPKWISEGKKIGGVISKEDFIDIGTLESLNEFKEKKNTISG